MLHPYKRKFNEATEISLPDGFKKEYAGGNIDAFVKALSNGKVIALFGANDGAPVEASGDKNTAQLFPNFESWKNNDNVTATEFFSNKAELDAILSKWDAPNLIVEKEEAEDGARNFVERFHIYFTSADGEEYTGTLHDVGDNVEVDWSEGSPEEWEEINDFMNYQDIYKMKHGERKEFSI